MILALASSAAYGAEVKRTQIVDNVTILFPDKIPTYIVVSLLQVTSFDIPVQRTIAVLWSGSDAVSNVSFCLSIPPGAVMSEGVILERIEASYLQRVTFIRPERGSVSWLNFSSYRDETGRLVYAQTPEALFGRAQLGWKVDELVNQTVPATMTVSIRIPPDAKVRYSSLLPAIQGNLYLFHQSSGFIYIESSATKRATIELLLMLVIAIVLVFFAASSKAVGLFRSKVLRWVERRFGWLSLPVVLAAFGVFFALTVGLSYLAGPAPRVNIVAVTGPSGDYVFGLSEGPASVIRGTERALELMLEFGVVDMVVIEDYKFAQDDVRWKAALASAIDRGVPVYLEEGTLTLNQDFLAGLGTGRLPSADKVGFLRDEIERIEAAKKKENRLGLGWKAFFPVLIIIVGLSLLTIMMGAMSAGYFALHLREKVSRSVNRLAMCLGSFFVFFVLCVVLYTASSYLLRMPLGWHGPLGRGITAISLVSPYFAGGNFPRAFFALLGLGVVLLLFVSRSKLRVSFSLLAIFGLLLIYLFVSNPLTAPTLFRFISGETPNTAPKDYFSRASVNFLMDFEYRFHESAAGVIMAALGLESLETWLSRGMIASLAFAGAFFILTRNSRAGNAMVIPVLFLVVSRLFARVGDLQIMKSLWTLPTALVIAAVITVALKLVDAVASVLNYYLSDHADRTLHMLVFVALPLVVGFLILYGAAGTDNLLQVVVGWFLLVVAALSARNPWQLPRLSSCGVRM